MNKGEIIALAKRMINDQQCMRQQIKDNPSLGFDWSWEENMTVMACLPSQMYGPRIEKRIIKELGARKISNKEDRGDMEKNGKFEENKNSIILNDHCNFNMVQIRPWQEVDYIISCSDMRDVEQPKIYWFHLSNEEMKLEIERLGSNAHGNELSLINNLNKEKRISINLSSEDFDRWIENYSSSLNEISNDLV